MYLVDSDILIQSKNFHYGFDICSGFWDWLEDASQRGVVGSIEAVKKELTGRGDDLSAWVNSHPDFFLTPDAATLAAMPKVIAAVQTPRYPEAQRTTFLAAADPLLIACATAGGHVVVSNEKPQPLAKKVKIPDVCLALGVPTKSVYEAMRVDGADLTFDGGQKLF